MKYQKPQARSLSEISFASGACSSGTWVGICQTNSGFMAGICTTGLNASNGNCTTGNIPVDTCVAGPSGIAANCTSGYLAAP